MFAAIVSLSIDPAQAPAAAAAFTKEILPKVRSAPGLLAAYWIDPEEGRGLGFLLFDTDANARQSTPPISSWAAPGVTIHGTDIRRVAVSI
jgi:hypothetical protein